MKIELGKEYQTRDGREVRIYAVDGEGDYPVHGAVKESEGWAVETWCEDGAYFSDGPSDTALIEKPKVHELWLNCYAHGSYVYDSRVEADSSAGGHRLACVKVTFTEGEGLS